MIIFKDMFAESKIMASTLIISLLLHMGLLCLFTVFTAKKQYPEKVLTVGLVLPSSIGDPDLRPERFIPQISGRTLGKIIHKPMADIKKEISYSDTSFQGNNPPMKKDMSKTVVVNKPDALSPGYSQSIFIKQNNSSDFGGTNKDKGETTLISDNSNGGSGLLGTGSPDAGGKGIGTDSTDFGKKVIEGEFGAIQGLSFLKMVKPDYPILARRIGKEGKVLLRLFIDEQGKVTNVEIIKRAGYGFDEAAIEAMKASTFVPAKVAGKATACRALVPIKFTLKKEG